MTVLSARSLAADHPHAGGENLIIRCHAVRLFGPSPRGWGEPSPRSCAGRARRTIPTRVGRTSTQQSGVRPRSDHPHAGGENVERGGGVTTVSGPSPRGWGEPIDGRNKVRHQRTIPTRVGRTTRWPRLGCQPTDHPHAGGENFASIPGIGRVFGPSPRGWGEQERGSHFRDSHRTIPTRVGRTHIGFRS